MINMTVFKKKIEKCTTTITTVCFQIEIYLIFQEWIGNRNARERRENGVSRPPSNKVGIPTGTNGYSLFAKTVKRGLYICVFIYQFSIEQRDQV